MWDNLVNRTAEECFFHIPERTLNTLLVSVVVIHAQQMTACAEQVEKLVDRGHVILAIPLATQQKMPAQGKRSVNDVLDSRRLRV